MIQTSKHNKVDFLVKTNEKFRILTALKLCTSSKQRRSAEQLFSCFLFSFVCRLKARRMSLINHSILILILIRAVTGSYASLNHKVLTLALLSGHFGYSRTDQKRWALKYPECAGNYQSPVAIVTEKVFIESISDRFCVDDVFLGNRSEYSCNWIDRISQSVARATENS